MTIDASSIPTLVEGEGSRTFLLLNGGSQSLHTWDHVVPALLDWGRVIRLDVPGVGESPSPTLPYSFEELSAAVLEVSRPHVVGRLIVVGHAWGARATQVIARDCADEVAGVVIGSNGGKFPPLNTPEQMRALADARSEGDDKALDAALEDVFFAEGFRERDPGRAQWLLDLMRSTPADRSMISGAVRLTPPDSYWGQFDCPALLLYGDEDRIGHRENAEDLHQALSGSKLVYIEQSGHFVIAEKAERFSAEILKWVEEVGL